MTEETQTFDIGYHRFVAAQIESGRAARAMIEDSHEHLLAEVERLTYLVPPLSCTFRPARSRSRLRPSWGSSTPSPSATVQ